MPCRHLLSGDQAWAQKVVERDAAIDQLQQQIFFQMNVVLGRQQAMAQDLREIMAAGRIAAHLERVADHAKNIARRALELDRNIDEEISSQLQWMNDRISTMLDQVMGAYQRRNAAESIIPWSSDTELDIVYGKLFAHLMERMQQNPDAIKKAIAVTSNKGRYLHKEYESSNGIMVSDQEVSGIYPLTLKTSNKTFYEAISSHSLYRKLLPQSDG